MSAATFAGNLTANGNIVLGNASSDTVAITGIITLGLLSTLTVPIGAAATPSLNFTSSLTTGFSCAGADTLIISTAATARITISSAGLITVGTGGVIANVLGAVTVPSYSFTGDLNTGMWSSAADTINFSTAGGERARITSAGFFGVGKTPEVQLDTMYSTSSNVLTEVARFGVRYTAGANSSTVGMIPIATLSGQIPSGAYNASAQIAMAGVGAVFETATFNVTTAIALYTRSTNVGLTDSFNERLRVASDGVVTLVGGIKFPATQAASSDVNTLDDYEEGGGTVTITPGSGAFSNASGTVYYTKIGRVVHVTGSAVIVSKGTADGQIRFDLPFTVARDAGAVGREQQATGFICAGYFQSGTAYAYISKYDSSSIIADGRTVIFSGHYEV